MRGGDEDLLDEVVLHRRGARLAFTAALLRPVQRDRVALHVARVADRDHHVLVGDEVFGGEVARFADDFGAARIGEIALHLAQLRFDDVEEKLLGTEDGAELRDELLHLGELVDDLLLLQPGQPLQLHLEDGLRLDLGELVEQLQLIRGRLAIRRSLDYGDDLVDVVEGDLVAEQDVLALPRLA